MKSYALDNKFAAYQSVQIDSSSDHIPAQYANLLIVNAELATKVLIYLGCKEGYLPLVVFLVVEEPISTQPASGDTLDRGRFNDWLFTRGLTVVPKEVMLCRNVEPNNLDRLNLQYDLFRTRPITLR